VDSCFGAELRLILIGLFPRFGLHKEKLKMGRSREVKDEFLKQQEGDSFGTRTNSSNCSDKAAMNRN